MNIQPPVPYSKKKRTILNWLLFSMLFFFLGRVQESIYLLQQLRLVFVFAAIIAVTLLVQGGLSKYRLSLPLLSPTFKWFAIFIALAVLAAPFSNYPIKSLSKLKMVILFFGIFFLLLNCQVNERKDFKTVLVGAATTLSIFGIIGILMQVIHRGEQRLVSNGSYDPNDTALFIVMMLAILFPFYWKLTKKIRILFWALTVLSLAALVLTESRGGLVALVGTAVYWALSKGAKGVLRLCLLGTLAISLILALAPAQDLARYETLFNLGNDYNLTARGGRLDVWQNGLTLLKESPVFGTGVNTFVYMEGQTHEYGKWSAAHNSFLEIAVEMGLTGLFLLLMTLWSAFKHAKPRNENDTLGQGIRLSLVAFVLGGSFLSWGYHFVLYFVLGIAMIRERVLYFEDRVKPIEDKTRQEEAPKQSGKRYTLATRRYKLK